MSDAGADAGASTVAVTGTPGTGKTAATERLESDHDVIHLNEVVREEGLWTERDEERGSVVADLEAVREHLGDRSGIVESHLAHYLEADRVVVLRCEPAALIERLRDRGEPAATAEENAESEALDIVLSAAVSRHGEASVYEIDTTDRDPDDTAAAVRAVVAGEREPSAGTVDFTDYL